MCQFDLPVEEHQIPVKATPETSGMLNDGELEGTQLTPK